MDTTEIDNYIPKVNTSDNTERKWRTELYNRDTFYWLYDLLQQNPGDEYKIIAKLREFEQAIVNTAKPYRALMIDFRKYKYSGSRGVGQTERGVTSGKHPEPVEQQDDIEWQN